MDHAAAALLKGPKGDGTSSTVEEWLAVCANAAVGLQLVLVFEEVVPVHIVVVAYLTWQYIQAG